MSKLKRTSKKSKTKKTKPVAKPKLYEYSVEVAVSGTVDLKVMATSLDEAEALANDLTSNLFMGGLEYKSPALLDATEYVGVDSFDVDGPDEFEIAEMEREDADE